MPYLRYNMLPKILELSPDGKHPKSLRKKRMSAQPARFRSPLAGTFCTFSKIRDVGRCEIGDALCCRPSANQDAAGDIAIFKIG